MSYACNWMVTENEMAQYFYDNLESLFDKGELKYVCGQLEKAPTTGQLHFQGYLQLKKKKRLTWLKKNVSSTAHFDCANGSPPQCIAYCSKEDTKASDFIQFGTSTKAGKRTDLIAFKDAIKEGTHIDSLIDNFTVSMAQYPRFYNMVNMRTRPDPHPDFKVMLFLGKTGTGKTTAARSLSKDYCVVPITNKDLWFDGFCGEEVAIIDDYKGNIKRANLLRVLHEHVEKVPVKGGFTWWNPKTVIITTNFHPRHWYSDWEGHEEHYNALARRFHEVRIYLSDYTYYEEDPQDFFHNKITEYR